MKNVFVSSVMSGFTDERSATKTAVESLRQRAVMAEDFGAKPYSSQVACLEEVRQSDVFIAVLGLRYGFVTKSGLSVSEEEFNEARKRGLPILVFVQKGDLETQQSDFFARIGKYEEGCFVDFFKTPSELQTKVTKALFDYVGQPEVMVLKASEVAAHLSKFVPKRSSHNATSLGVVMFPARQGETYLSPIQMEDVELREGLMQKALFGKTAILERSDGTKIEDGTDHFGFAQGSRGQSVRWVHFHGDGTLVWETLLANEGGRDHSLVRQFVISKDDVQKRLEAFTAFAAAYYSGLEAGPHLSSFYVTIVLRGLQNKWFGHLPQIEPSGMSIAMTNIADPLLIPAHPYKVARAEMNAPPKLVSTLTTLVERTFKSLGRLYAP